MKFLSGILALAAIIVAIGCSSTPSGIKVVASAATYTNIGDINWEEYKIPILSLYLGPKATVWVHKDYKALEGIEICGCVTNSTSALGIYSSDEEKHLYLKLKFSDTSVSNIVENSVYEAK